MIRLDRVLANKGFGSRKEIKKIIKQKRVFVNDKLITKDDYKVVVNDHIVIDDYAFLYQEYVYIMLNKPSKVISATFDDLYPTVLDIIDDKTKGLFPVGRLDLDTEGFCLISNDGTLAHQLLSNKKHVDKVYEVYTKKKLSENDFSIIESGMMIDHGEQCLPALIKEVDDHYELTIQEGKYHQIKRMMIALNNEVVYLKRIKIGKLELDKSLSAGEYRYLSEEEVALLK